MVRKRRVALIPIALVLGGALTAVPPLTAGGTAGAISNSHHWIDTSRTSSLDIENAVKVKLTCSGISGAYSLVVSGINMVNGSGVSFAGPSGDTALVLYQPATNFIAKISTNQSTTNGLWEANSIGVMAASDCTRGLPLILMNHADWVNHSYFPAVQIYGQLA
jgi:hypothetical protein